MSSVYANGNAIACKSGDGKVVAAFPDVCMSPPSPPAGPIPVPYPDSSFSRDMKEGSRSVTVGGKEVMLKGQSYFKSSPLGDEAATRSFGGSIVTHTITGKTYFAASSMDVKIEGKNVCRHLDITTSNHASDPGATPPIPEAEAMSPGGGGEADVPLCDCCGKPAHSAMQAAGKVSLTEQEFYSPSPLRGDPPAFAEEARTLMAEIRSGPCKNILPPKNPGPRNKCAKFYITDEKTKKEKTKIENIWTGYKAKYMRKNKLPKGMGVSHRVPKAAGGCPTGWGNLTPTAPECERYERQLASLQNRAITYHRKRLGIPT